MLIEGYRCVWGGGVELPSDRRVDTDTSAVEAELEEFIQAVGGARGLAAAARGRALCTAAAAARRR